jgi:hypothetical protein
VFVCDFQVKKKKSSLAAPASRRSWLDLEASSRCAATVTRRPTCCFSPLTTTVMMWWKGGLLTVLPHTDEYHAYPSLLLYRGAEENIRALCPWRYQHGSGWWCRCTVAASCGADVAGPGNPHRRWWPGPSASTSGCRSYRPSSSFLSPSRLQPPPSHTVPTAAQAI